MRLRGRAALLAALVATALAAPRAHAQRLFSTDSVLTATITTDLGPLLKQRDSLGLVKHAANFSYAGDDGKPVNIAVRLRARIRS